MVAGTTSGSNAFLLRYNSNGTLDTTFNTTGIVTYANATASAVAIQADGKVLVAGYDSNNGIILRYTASGNLDATFNATGVVTYSGVATDLALQADGKIIVGGTTLRRYNGDGALDSTYNGTGSATSYVSELTGVVIQTDGKAVVSGNNCDNIGCQAVITRYNANGSLDSSFSSGNILFPGRVNTLTVQTDGSIVLAGYFFNGVDNGLSVIRYNSNGTLDTSFNGVGFVTFNSPAKGYDVGRAVALQADGKILIAGNSFNGTTSDVLLLRLNGSGKQTFDNCAATITFGSSSSPALHIPIVNYSGAAFSVDFEYAQTSGGFIWFKYKGASAVSDISSYSNCTAASLSSSFGLYLPNVIINNIPFSIKAPPDFLSFALH